MKKMVAGLICCSIFSTSHAQQGAGGNTVFALTEGNREVIVDAIDDPVVEGVTCYISRARSIVENLAVVGSAETLQTAIACRQAGPIRFRRPLAKEEIFEKSASPPFRSHPLRVIRIVDPKRKTLTYLTFPETAISTVAVAGRRIPVQ